MSDVDDRADVDDLKQRVGRGFEIHQLRAAVDRFPHRIKVGEVDIANVDAALGQDAGEQPISSAIEIVAGQDLFAGRQKSGDRSDRRQPGAETKAASTVFQRCNVFLHYIASWIATAGVVVLAELGGVLLPEGRRLVDRCVGRGEAIARRRVESQ